MSDTGDDQRGLAVMREPLWRMTDEERARVLHKTVDDLLASGVDSSDIIDALCAAASFEAASTAFALARLITVQYS